MELAVTWVDVSAFKGTGIQPAHQIERTVGEPCEYWVLQSSALDAEPRWGFTGTGLYVRVPIFTYTAPSALAALFATGAQLGVTAVLGLRRAIRQAPEIRRLHLIIGNDCEQVPSPDRQSFKFRCHIGIAIAVPYSC